MMIQPRGVIFFVVVSLIMMGFLIYEHESAHQQIFAQFNIRSHLGFDGASFYAQPVVLDAERLGESDLRTIAALQSVNEAFFYPFGVLLSLQLFLLFFMIFREKDN